MIGHEPRQHRVSRIVRMQSVGRKLLAPDASRFDLGAHRVPYADAGDIVSLTDLIVLVLRVDSCIVEQVVHDEQRGTAGESAKAPDKALIGLLKQRVGRVVYGKLDHAEIGLIRSHILRQPRNPELRARASDTRVHIGKLRLRKTLHKPAVHQIRIAGLGHRGKRALSDGTAEETKRQLLSLFRAFHQ